MLNQLFRRPNALMTCLGGLVLLAILLGAAQASEAAYISTTKRVTLSTSTAVEILPAEPKAQGTTVLFQGTTDYCMLGDADTTFSNSSSTGTFRLYGSSTPFILDGMREPFQGPLWGKSGGTTSVVIDVIQRK